MKLRYLMPTVALCLSTAVFADHHGGEPTLEKKWQTEAVFDVPESVLYDSERQLLYVSNMGSGDGWADDGNGFISKLALDGSVEELKWIADLHAPKGMGILDEHLYATDNDDVLKIDIEKGEVVGRYEVPDAGTINDLSIAEDGTIYITDSKFGNIHTFIDGTFTTIVSGRNGLNGVLHSDGELLFVDSGSLYLVKDNDEIVEIAGDLEGATDGIERIDENSWLVSCWQGTVYHVTRDGETTLLLDGRPTKTSAADLGYDPERRIAYFPGFFRNFVAAYELKR